MRRFSLIRLICLMILIVFAVSLCHRVTAKRVHAESLSVSLRVGSTQVIFSGYTSPNAYVAIKQAGVVIGSTTADQTGGFSKTIEVDDSGITTFELYGIDASNHQTSTIAYTLNVDPGVAITVGNIVLPSTIYQANNPQYQGDIINLGGYTHPSATLTILISDGSTHSVSADPDGHWQFGLSMGSFSGTFTLYVTSQLPSGHHSLKSQTLSYTLLPRPSQQVPSDTPIDVSPTKAPTLLPPWLTIFDHNGDNLLSLEELYEIVRRWVTDWKSSFSRQTGDCDLNHDGVCTLVDFSILLYYIGR